MSLLVCDDPAPCWLPPSAHRGFAPRPLSTSTGNAGACRRLLMYRQQQSSSVLVVPSQQRASALHFYRDLGSRPALDEWLYNGGPYQLVISTS